MTAGDTAIAVPGGTGNTKAVTELLRGKNARVKLWTIYAFTLGSAVRILPFWYADPAMLLPLYVDSAVLADDESLVIAEDWPLFEIGNAPTYMGRIFSTAFATGDLLRSNVVLEVMD